MASRAGDRTAEDVCQRVMPAHALWMAHIHRERSSQKRRSPRGSEKRSPSMPVVARHSADDDSRSASLSEMKVKIYADELESGSSGFEEALNSIERTLQWYLKWKTMEEHAAAADNPDNK